MISNWSHRATQKLSVQKLELPAMLKNSKLPILSRRPQTTDPGFRINNTFNPFQHPAITGLSDEFYQLWQFPACNLLYKFAALTIKPLV